jgi:glycosyltransferase involved in cell wall biosynthesis
VDVLSLKEDVSEPLISHEEGYVNPRVTTRYIGNNLFSYFKYYLLFTLRCFFIVSRLSLYKKIHVVHYNNLPNFPVFSAIIPRLLGARIILDNHDLIGVMFTSKFYNSPSRSLMIKVLWFEQYISMAFSHRIITADHNQEKALLNDKVPKCKVTVLLNLANPEWFKPQRQHNRQDKQFRLIYHGTVARRLGLDLAIRAVAKAKDHVPGLRFHLIGKGDFLDECLRLIEELSLHGIVIPSKCYYPVTKLPEIIHRMDAGIITNRQTLATDRYMLPVKLLEYVQMRVPVIAPRLNIIQQYFDEDMLMFFDPGDVDQIADCIINLYRDRNLQQALVEKSQEFFRCHNWQKQQDDYLALVEGRAKGQ